MSVECPGCGSVHETERGRKIHYAKAHDGPPYPWIDRADFDCPSCTRAFDSMRGVKVHHAQVHGESIAGKTAECTECGESVTRTPAEIERVGAVYCSTECRDKGQREQIELICEECGEDYNRIPSEATNSRFCSDECRWSRLSGEQSPNWKREARVCKGCSESFEVPPSWPDKFCSPDCYIQWRVDTGEFVDDGHPRWNSEEIECHTCGGTFTRAVSQMAGHERVFCSLSCRSEWQRESDFASGENNHFWAGGYEPYYGPNWHQQRRKARERDGHTCQRCGVSESDLGQELSVHHITPFREFVPDDGEPSYEAANALDNLVSLCEPCHKQVEGTGIRPKLTD